MSIIAKQGATRDAIPEGQYTAICTRVIDLGDQENKKFGKTNRQVMFCWELPDCTIDVDGNPMPRHISRDFTLSLGEKSALRPFLEAWRGATFTEDQLSGFDLKNVLGAPCLLQVIHNEAGYERISSIMKLPGKMERPTPATELLLVDFDSANFMETIDKLPDWIKDKVKASPQYAEVVSHKSGAADAPGGFTELDDDGEELPF